eukprot:jgi/Mesen1/9094/ME000058S08594
METFYTCRCGLTCSLSASDVIADSPDALLFEGVGDEQLPTPRSRGEPLLVQLDLEASSAAAVLRRAGRARAGEEGRGADLFVSYGASSDVQCTYAGNMFRVHRNRHVARLKRQDVLVHWASSHCVKWRDELVASLLPVVPTHSTGACLNNMRAPATSEVDMYPECAFQEVSAQKTERLPCVQSHYKFSLGVENLEAPGYATEKLFLPLDSGACTPLPVRTGRWVHARARVKG